MTELYAGDVLYAEDVDGDAISAVMLRDGNILVSAGGAGSMHLTPAQFQAVGRAAKVAESVPARRATVLPFRTAL